MFFDDPKQLYQQQQEQPITVSSSMSDSSTTQPIDSFSGNTNDSDAMIRIEKSHTSAALTTQQTAERANAKSSNNSNTMKKRKSTLFRRSTAFMRLFNRNFSSTNLLSSKSNALDETAECQEIIEEENQQQQNAETNNNTNSNNRKTKNKNSSEIEAPNKLKGYVCYNQILAYLK